MYLVVAAKDLDAKIVPRLPRKLVGFVLKMQREPRAYEQRCGQAASGCKTSTINLFLIQ